ncbi:lipoate--protein ligase family protein [Phosphitispora fastidiosa]|uniref:lipoate--protein ligase family protein n=1 Tax=Phosphitispora fastidiosa TaxID=2837202 RepID=UPI001E3525C0|nr:lipoate--protein ligase family protein [Phosphitispora fastidiosa]MBU7005754.1 lipoate-protein ligase A [Phosphitispora fastidiosa]
MEKWRLIVDKPLPAAMNMAFDEAVMNSVMQGLAPPTIRFYRWTPPAVSLGYFQKLEQEIDVEACKREGVDVVRRLTGGRAVLHQDEFTYSVIAPEDNQKIAGSILQSYLAVSRGLVKGLAELGVQAELSEGKKHTEFNSAACFDAPSWYEMVVGGRKLVGSAQTRRGGCLLQHGSIPVKMDTDLLFSVLNFSSEKLRERAKSYFLAKATCLSEILDYSPEYDKMCECFKYGFETVLGISLREAAPLAEEEDMAAELSAGRYAADDWNRRR